MVTSNGMNRRGFLAAAMSAGAAAAAAKGKMEFCVFSKPLQFLSWAEMGAAAISTMLERLRHPTLPARDILLNFRLVVRQSSGGRKTR